MEENIYQAPDSEIIPEGLLFTEFYIVSPRKFLLLFFITMGLYSIYWFYQHWALYKIKHQESMWPVMRAIFQIFFAHSLFERINSKLVEEKIEFDWSPSGLATIFVVLRIIENVAERLAYKEIGSPTTDIISLAIFPVIGILLYNVQKAANFSMQDPQGSANSQLTAGNYIWIVLGSIFWLFAGFGYYVVFFGVPEFSY